MAGSKFEVARCQRKIICASNTNYGGHKMQKPTEKELKERERLAEELLEAFIHDAIKNHQL